MQLERSEPERSSEQVGAADTVSYGLGVERMSGKEQCSSERCRTASQPRARVQPEQPHVEPVKQCIDGVDSGSNARVLGDIVLGEIARARE